MGRIAVIIASVAINASTVLALAAESTSNKDLDAARALWATLQSQPAKDAGKEKICRAYAASYYQSAVLRQVAAGRVHGERALAVLDSVIDAFNDLLASKCGG